MTTVTENLDRARKIRDERKEQQKRYVAALEGLYHSVLRNEERMAVGKHLDAVLDIRGEMAGIK